MPTAFLRVIGLVEAIDFLEDLIDGARKMQTDGWYVVSVVDYAAIQEWGAINHPARPHWRVAIQKIADNFNMVIEGEEQLIDMIIAGGGLTKKIALSLKAEVRRQIKAQGIFRTGNYYGSIGIGRTLEEAIADSQSKLIDPSSSAVS